MKTSLKSLAIGLAFAIYNAFAKKTDPKVDLPSDPFEAIRASFDAVWVLTIPRSERRRQSISAQFQGLDFEFFYGVEGKSMTRDDPQFDFATCEKLHGRPIKTNELACTFSHVKMYQRMLDEGLERVLIFEDDAVIDRSKTTWISYILSRLPDDWELLYLGYRDGELRGFVAEFFERFGRKRTSAVVSRSVCRGLRTAAGHDFTHAYALTRKGAEKLLETAFPLHQTADGMLEENVLAGRIRAYVTVPKLFVQLEDLGSSIHESDSVK